MFASQRLSDKCFQPLVAISNFYCRSRRSGSRVCAGVSTGNGMPTDRKS